jgi:uncharacterized protein
MDFEWDDAKRRATIVKHGIDFGVACKVLEGRNVRSEKVVGGEVRYMAIGLGQGNLVAVVYTFRGANVRLITARRARENERRAYRELFD